MPGQNLRPLRRSSTKAGKNKHFYRSFSPRRSLAFTINPSRLFHYWSSLILLFVFVSCKAIQTTAKPPGAPDPVIAAPPEIVEQGGTLDGVGEPGLTPAPGGEVADSPTGPYLPPDIPDTRFEPFIQRSVLPKPPLPRPRNKCSLAVEVRNYDGLDGCGLLLETDSGVLLRVGIRPRGEPIEAGTRISIGFEYMTQFESSPCTNEDAVIRITCMRLLRVSSGLPRPVVCESYEKPARWLVEAAQDVAATYITRFPWKDERFVYLLESPEGQFLYDCRGYLICRPRKNCLGFIESFSEGEIIYEN